MAADITRSPQKRHNEMMALFMLPSILLFLFFGALFWGRQQTVIADGAGRIVAETAEDISAFVTDELRRVNAALAAASFSSAPSPAMDAVAELAGISGAAVSGGGNGVSGCGDFNVLAFREAVMPSEPGIYCVMKPGTMTLFLVAVSDEEGGVSVYSWYTETAAAALLRRAAGAEAFITDAAGAVLFTAEGSGIAADAIPIAAGKPYAAFTSGDTAYYAAADELAGSGLFLTAVCRQSEFASYAAELNGATAVFYAEAALVVGLLVVLLSMFAARRRRAVEAEKELWRVNAQRYQAAVDQADGIVFEYNLVDHTAMMSRRFSEILGRSPGTGNWPESIIASEAVAPDDAPAVRQFWTALLGGGEMSDRELRVRHADGHYIWFRVSASVIKDGRGRPVRIIGNLINIDAAKRELAALANMAQRDPLTGLYNKTSTEDAAAELLARGGDAHHAMFFIDLDNFKSVNDTFGHTDGDIVLTEVASVMEHCFRATDITGRVGGDEFLVVAGGLGADKAKLTEKAQELSRGLAQLRYSRTHGFPISASVGVACFPEDGATYGELYYKADSACYTVKEQGKAGFSLYGSQSVTHATENGEPQ